MSNILLYGGGLQVLSIARSLKDYHHKVYVVNDDNALAKCCRYVDSCKSVMCGDAHQLMTYIKDWSIEVVIPMEDKWAEALSVSKHFIESESSAKCAICDIDTYRVASDKTQLLGFCELHNIPHPRTRIISHEIDEAIEYVGFPLLIKPSCSEGARGILHIENKEALLSIVKSHTEQYGECSLQEYIENDHYYNVMLYRSADGSYANHVITNITRFYPIKGGSSSFCTTIENAKLLSICKELLDKLGWVGFADFDVLEKGEGDFRIIEINPRVPASVRAAAISGVNFGEIIVSDLLRGCFPTYEYIPGRHLRYLGLDIAWFLASPNRFKTEPSWFRFLGTNLFYQEGGCKDFVAMLASIFIGVKKMISPSFRKQKTGMN